MRRGTLHTVILFFAYFLWCNIAFSVNYTQDDFSERAKIVLRRLGDQLLLTNNDSTSLVLPIIEKENFLYKLSFENEISILPNMLVKELQTLIKKKSLSNKYRVEVKQCSNNEVAYSYEMNASEERVIIPCGARTLPKACYYIEIKFLDLNVSFGNSIWSKLIVVALVLLCVVLFITRKKSVSPQPTKNQYTSIGIFRFYPNQHILTKEAEEISLSKKESELLAIFIKRPNQVIQRDELTKKVWEDKGVIVGRSLDTYISKLRKKLKEDTSIKLTNIHGVGYKLEINK
jgi:DNA-binding winged helix-turn-helix (wHTH) protein